MSFIPITGFPGKLYVPEHDPNLLKKHPCPDCFFCQMCNDTRCCVCIQQNQKTTTPADKDENQGICKTLENPCVG
jgi:hypothetical protein